MLREVLLTDNEVGTILGLCQFQLQNLKTTTNQVPFITKLTCARLGLVICKVKGFVPHYNEAYIATKGGWKRQYPTPTLLEDVITPKERRARLQDEGKWREGLDTITPSQHKADLKWRRTDHFS